jgi:CRP-like cAMP-binding protein
LLVRRTPTPSIGLLTCGRRTATIMALTDARLLMLEEVDFRNLRQAYPEMPAAIEAVVRNLVVQETPATKAARI